MKLVSFMHQGGKNSRDKSYGIWTETALSIWGRIGARYPTIKSLLAGDALVPLTDSSSRTTHWRILAIFRLSKIEQNHLRGHELRRQAP
jgi:hypothetical protein